MPGITYSVKGMNELRQLLRDMSEKGRQAAVEGIQDWTDYAYEVSQQLCPVDSGRLALSGRVEKNEDGAAIIYDAPYAAAVHYGYVRHWVAPKNRKALRWEGGGGRVARLIRRGSRKGAQWAFSKGHFVPAQRARSRPNPWLFKATDSSLQYLKDFILASYEQAIPEAG